MRWSVSSAKIFSKCQRKWYFTQIAASHGKKDPLRREIYLLKQLKSISAWRGILVDTVIKKAIVPELLLRKIPSEDKVLKFASSIIERQLEFGRALRFREPDMTKSKAGDDYAAFYDLEYNDGLDDTKIQTAIEEIEASLLNLLKSNFLKNIFQSSSQIIAQRTLTHYFEYTTLTCTPDLIVFFERSEPMVVDWKVHAFGTVEYWLQLGIYGYVLSLIEPHRDFPKEFQLVSGSLDNYKLIEYQLLRNQIRKYSLSRQDIADLEDYIFNSINQMKRLVNGKKYKELDINLFQTTRFPNICTRCEFKKICWKDDEYE
ncbi:MAG: PD-(D/E)XK nuclease family protein [Candidatus Helarchaeota archaeon]|nr:PD-(D/E)XK nuclease family protein [Candidatus Helarchaeota archaeon]